jgi:plastocyanin
MRAAGGGARVWFDPVGLHVPPGTTVRWVRVEGVHTTTAYHPSNGDLPRRIPGGARPWDSGYLTEPGATFEVTLEAEGVYDYFCRPHEAAGMAGRIVVSGEDRPATDRAAAWRGAEPDDRMPVPVRQTLPAVEAILERGRVPAGTPGG